MAVNALVISLAAAGFILAALLCVGLKYVQKREAYYYEQQVSARKENEQQMEEGNITLDTREEEEEEAYFSNLNSMNNVHPNPSLNPIDENSNDVKILKSQSSDSSLDVAGRPFTAVSTRKDKTASMITHASTIQQNNKNRASSSILKNNESEKLENKPSTAASSTLSPNLNTPNKGDKKNDDQQFVGGKNNDAFTPRSWRSSQASSSSVGFGWKATSPTKHPSLRTEPSSNTFTTSSSQMNLTAEDRRNKRIQEEEFFNETTPQKNIDHNIDTGTRPLKLKDTSTSTGIGTIASKTSGDSSGNQTSSSSRSGLERKMSVDRSSGRMMIRFDSTRSALEPTNLNNNSSNCKVESTNNNSHSNDDANSTLVKQHDAKQIGWAKFKTFFSHKGTSDNPEHENVNGLATQEEDSYPWHYLVTDSQSLAGSTGKYSNTKLAMLKSIEEENKARHQMQGMNVNRDDEQSPILEQKDITAISEKEWYERMAQLPFKFDPKDESIYSGGSDAGKEYTSKGATKTNVNQIVKQSDDSSSSGFFVIKKDDTTQIYNYDLESESDKASTNTPKTLYRLDTLISAVEDVSDTNSQELRKAGEIAEINNQIGRIHSQMSSSKSKVHVSISSTAPSEPLSNPNAPRCNSIVSASSTQSNEDSVMMLAADRKKQRESENQLFLATKDESILARTTTNNETILDEPNSEEWEEEARARILRARAKISHVAG